MNIPIAKTNPIPIDKYLVILCIFFLPSSPSLESCSNEGIAIVNNCTMIEALIYGETAKANMLKFFKAPPDIKL